MGGLCWSICYPLRILLVRIKLIQDIHPVFNPIAAILGSPRGMDTTAISSTLSKLVTTSELGKTFCIHCFLFLTGKIELVSSCHFVLVNKI